jgi:diacylglycerol O-acyltransferase
LETVLEMARLAQMEDFDRARPLWKATLIDGLADGGAAVLCVFHHALTDGVGGVQIGMTLFDLDERPRRFDSVTAEPQVSESSWLGEYGDVLGYDAALAGNVLKTTVKSASSLL